MAEPVLQPSHQRNRGLGLVAAIGLIAGASPLLAQSVGLPAPRLLTTYPMGGQVGTQFEVTITGEELDGSDPLVFSDPRITAAHRKNDAGAVEPFKFTVSVAADCPPGLYEARVMSRLGMSSSRAFSVGTLTEVVRTTPNTTLATARELPVNSICNAVMTQRAIDFYSFQGRQGQRIVVDCATRGIDSKLDAVVIIADAAGRDLLVERRGGTLDFQVPADGKYIIKVHELTFKGGPAYFYRMAVTELAPAAPIVRLPSTRPVNSFSWPPVGLPDRAVASEIEPNNAGPLAQVIELPCDLDGSFFPAADVDVYQFPAKKGESWWVEVGSERFGLPTDPAVIVQQVRMVNGVETVTDLAEFSDIPSPVKVSSNGYAYDGPPYNAGTSDVLGKIDIPEDGTYRLQVSDLFGGTRTDPRNVYRLVVRKAAPDFALVAWAMHMELRNGDRNAVSKPLALRGGATMALEVVALRRDGFQGDITLAMEGLPEGVSASGLKIPAGQSRGLVLVTAHQNAPRGLTGAVLTGRAEIGGAEVKRPCRLASMSWPILDAWNEIPSPRLMADVPVSVSGEEFAPVSIRPASPGMLTVVAGEKLKVPLALTRRSEFSGAAMQVNVMGAGFERTPQFSLGLTADSGEATLDTAALKVAPGDYLIALYGGAVARYRHRPDVLAAAEQGRQKAEQDLMAADAEVKKLTDEVKAAAAETRSQTEMALQAAMTRQKAAAAALTAAAERVKSATATAAPRDIVDIVVSEPIAIRVTAAEKK